MLSTLARIRAEKRRGATVVEYVIMVALVAVVILATLSALGTATSNSLDASRQQIAEATDAAP